MAVAPVNARAARGLLPTCALAAALALPAPASAKAEAKATIGPAIVGQWRLIPDRSDDGERALDVLAPRRGDAFGPREPGGQGGGWGRHRGMGGGGMGRRGGMGGAPGGFGGGRSGPPRRRFSPVERAAVRQAVRFAVESPTTVDIRQQDGALIVAYPDGRARRLTADGHKHKLAGYSQKVQWKDRRLVVETKAGDLKIKETFDTVAEQGLLHVDATVDDPRYKGELKLTRIYRKDDAPAPAASGTEPVAPREEP